MVVEDVGETRHCAVGPGIEILVELDESLEVLGDQGAPIGEAALYGLALEGGRARSPGREERELRLAARGHDASGQTVGLEHGHDLLE